MERLSIGLVLLLVAGCDCGASHSGDAGDVVDVAADAGVACTANCCVESDPLDCERVCGLVCP